MKIYSNEKLIKRNSRIGNITSLLSIAILGIGMYFSFTDKDGSNLPITFTSLIVGFLMFQVGNYFMAKWGKPPRPDQKLSQLLKGLDDKYSLYHYTTTISHLLVGPAGFICILPYNQAGSISYDGKKGRWKQSGGNFFLKAFGGESLGKPEQDARYAVLDAEKLLSKLEISSNSIQPEPIVVFINEKATLEPHESEIPVMAGEKLKDFLRKKAKEKTVSAELIAQIQQKLT